jgi:pseudaminic acid biosynthesis-associated methylase
MTDQAKVWTSEFGSNYTGRNTFTVESFNELYLGRYGISRDDICSDWLSDVPRDARILEVGCNVGYQLAALQRVGFENLYGVEIQRSGVEESKKIHNNLDIVEGDALDVPFRDGFFDLVFTNNFLIHIAPSNIPTVLSELHRLSKQYIWGFEYYAPEITEIKYRGHENLLWKADYGSLLANQFSDTEIVREKEYDCLDEPGLVDKSYLLEKSS